MAIDPVCKMRVEEKTARFTSVFQGKTYYFCAEGCKRAFEQNPPEYVRRSSAQAAQRPEEKHQITREVS